MSTAVFISPHLDDALFSCSVMIQRRKQAGDRVVIVSVFTEGTAGYEKRRAEDILACSWIGAEAVHLGHLDAPDRNPARRNFRALLFDRHAQDATTRTAVEAALKPWSCLENTSIFVPLGVGTHVDHRIVQEAVDSLTWSRPVTFYEDRPYAYAQGAAELRLHELGFYGGEVDQTALLRSFRQLPHVKRYLPPGPQRRACESLLLAPLASAAQALATPQLLYATVQEARSAHQAAFCYATQFSDFCGSPRGLARMDRRHALWLSSTSLRVERFWHLHPRAPES